MSENKILVVDDILKNIQLLGSLLGKEGYAVSYATSGARALEMVASEDYDLILLDVMMPGMDGYEVCQHLKTIARTEHIPVLFLTAKNEQDDIVKGFDSGAVDYLTKPINPAELKARVKTQLALRKAKRVLLERNLELEAKNARLAQLLEEKRQALDEIKTLQGLLPICAHCKNIRNDEGAWTSIEAYIAQHSDVEFSHGMCESCLAELYPDYYPRKKK